MCVCACVFHVLWFVKVWLGFAQWYMLVVWNGSCVWYGMVLMGGVVLSVIFV